MGEEKEKRLMHSDSELEFRVGLAATLARMEEKLDDLGKLAKTVQEHDRDISRWKGINGALAFLLTVIAAFYGKIKLWH